MIKQIIWDIREDEQAHNCDGELAFMDGDEVVVKDIGCSCDPSSGSCCGGCIDIWNRFVIGEGKYEYRFINSQS